MLTLTPQQLTTVEVQRLLRDFDTMFLPALSNYVDIDNYSMKLAKHAHFILCKNGEEVVGYIAFYENKETKVDYIPSICVRDTYRMKGVASLMMDFLISQAPTVIEFVALEVRLNNEAAARFYKKQGFVTKEERGEKILMIKQIYR